MITVWTYQTPDWEFWHVPRIVGRSEYVKKTKGITPNYSTLHSRLGTEQFIWCSTQRQIWDKRKEYEITIPETHQYWFVDSNIWNFLIGAKGLSDHRHQKIRESVRHLGEDRDAEMKKLVAEFWQSIANLPNPWEKLLLPKITNDANVIVSIPLNESWVKAI